MGFLGDQLLHLGCGLFIALASYRALYLGPLPVELCQYVPIMLQPSCRMPQSDFLRQIGQFVSWGVLFAGIAVGSGTFGNERVVFWRERASGIHTTPYFLAKSIADIPRIMIAAGCFQVSFMVGFNNMQAARYIYLFIFSLYFVGFSSGYFISAVVAKQKTSLVGVVFALVWAIALSGVEPNLIKVQDFTGVSWLWSISAPRWAISAFYLNEVYVKKYQEIQVGINAYGYQNDDWVSDIVYTFLIGIGWQVMAFLAMKLLHRSK